MRGATSTADAHSAWNSGGRNPWSAIGRYERIVAVVAAPLGELRSFVDTRPTRVPESLATARRGSEMRVRVIIVILVFSAVSLVVVGAVAAQDAPDIPDPVAVVLDHETTALLVLDMIESICNRYEVCVNGSAP